MSGPALVGALAGLRTAGPEDLPGYKAAASNGGQMGWGYHFPYLLSQIKRDRCAILLGEDAGSLCVFRWKRQDDGERLDLYLPPMPFEPDVLRRCLERTNAFHGDRSAMVCRVDAREAEVMGKLPGLRLKPRREQYLFAPSGYGSLAGGKLRLVRRNVQLVEAMAELHTAPLVRDRLPACRELLRRWRDAHRTAHGTAGGAGGSRRALDLVGRLPAADLRGEVILLGDRLVGFAFGGEIRPGLACAFERKCDPGIRGLNYFQFRRMLQLLGDCQLVNDGSDTGREGLRQFKQSFRPVAMHTEWRATQRQAR